MSRDLAWPIISEGEGRFTVLEPDGSVYAEGLPWERAYAVAATQGADCEWCQGEGVTQCRDGHWWKCERCDGSGKAADDPDVVADAEHKPQLQFPGGVVDTSGWADGMCQADDCDADALNGEHYCGAHNSTLEHLVADTEPIYSAERSKEADDA